MIPSDRNESHCCCIPLAECVILNSSHALLWATSCYTCWPIIAHGPHTKQQSPWIFSLIMHYVHQHAKTISRQCHSDAKQLFDCRIVWSYLKQSQQGAGAILPKMPFPFTWHLLSDGWKQTQGGFTFTPLALFLWHRPFDLKYQLLV